MLADALGQLSGADRQRTVIGAFGQPLVLQRDLPQVLLDCGCRRFAGQLSDASCVAVVIFGRKRRFG